MSRTAVACVLVAGSLLAGCVSEGGRQHPISQGWHEATIYRIGGGFDTMHPNSFDCRVEDGGSASTYAQVDYRVARILHHRIALLPAQGPEFHVGDRVYVNVQDCTVALARRL